MGHEVQVSEMGVPCSMQGIDEIYVCDFSRKSWKDNTTQKAACLREDTIKVDLTSLVLECD